MEKLLEFEKSSWSEESKLYRFQCDCLSAPDAMDINVEACGKDAEGKFIIICMDFLGTGLWDRVKYAGQIIRGHWGWREFVVRGDDTRHLSDIFNPDKKYAELP